MRQHDTEPDKRTSSVEATDGTRRPGSDIVGEAPGTPRPWRRKPSFVRASLARDRTDPSRKAGRTAIAYLGVVLLIMALALGFVLLVGSDHPGYF